MLNINLSQKDLVTLFIKSTAKFYEAKDFIKQQNILNLPQVSKLSQNFEWLFKNEQEYKSENLDKKIWGEQKNTTFRADQVYSSQDLNWAKSKAKNNKQPVLKGRMIQSARADKILESLGKLDECTQEFLTSQKTLGRILWALSLASKNKITDGLSLHDISCLLEKYAEIKLYPINISKAIKSNFDLFKLQSQEKKTKRYALTAEGKRELKKLAE